MISLETILVGVLFVLVLASYGYTWSLQGRGDEAEAALQRKLAETETALEKKIDEARAAADKAQAAQHAYEVKAVQQFVSLVHIQGVENRTLHRLESLDAKLEKITDWFLTGKMGGK